MGTQKDRLNEIVLLITQNTLEIQFYDHNICKPGHMMDYVIELLLGEI